MTHPDVLAELRRLARDFRALGLADYARGRAERQAVWADAAARLDELADQLED